MADAQIKAAAEAAKQDQINSMRQQPNSLAAYWAGSASASVAHHVRRSAVRVIKAK
jgi:hypothetical protein